MIHKGAGRVAVGQVAVRGMAVAVGKHVVLFPLGEAHGGLAAHDAVAGVLKAVAPGAHGHPRVRRPEQSGVLLVAARGRRGRAGRAGGAAVAVPAHPAGGGRRRGAPSDGSGARHRRQVAPSLPLRARLFGGAAGSGRRRRAGAAHLHLQLQGLAAEEALVGEAADLGGPERLLKARQLRRGPRY